jgi:hypothetical protein
LILRADRQANTLAQGCVGIPRFFLHFSRSCPGTVLAVGIAGGARGPQASVASLPSPVEHAHQVVDY